MAQKKSKTPKSSKSKRKLSEDPNRETLTLGLPGGKKTPPPTVKRERVVRTGRDQRLKRTYDSPGGPV